MAQLARGFDIASNGTPEQLVESLERLSKKPGVVATIVLDRTTGAILKAIGSISISRNSSVTNTSPNNTATSGVPDGVTGGSEELGGIEQMAAMVWDLVNTTGGLVQALDAEDTIKLLRLRTKKHELVIVPDSKYLLIVVHDTPPARTWEYNFQAALHQDNRTCLFWSRPERTSYKFNANGDKFENPSTQGSHMACAVGLMLRLREYKPNVFTILTGKALMTNHRTTSYTYKEMMF